MGLYDYCNIDQQREYRESSGVSRSEMLEATVDGTIANSDAHCRCPTRTPLVGFNGAEYGTKIEEYIEEEKQKKISGRERPECGFSFRE
jgi:hypothetical protein